MPKLIAHSLDDDDLDAAEAEFFPDVVFADTALAWAFRQLDNQSVVESLVPLDDAAAEDSRHVDAGAPGWHDPQCSPPGAAASESAGDEHVPKPASEPAPEPAPDRVGTEAAAESASSPSSALPPAVRPQLWEVVGGAATGGLLVRKGESRASRREAKRLSVGTLLQEVELKQERLHFVRLTGTGPLAGWVSVTLNSRALVVRQDTTLPEDGPHRLEPLPVGILITWTFPHKMVGQALHLPEVENMMAKARPILGDGIIEACQHGRGADARVTSHFQSVRFIVGLAALEQLKAERPGLATRGFCTAGCSVMEYAALCAAGVMSFEDGLALVNVFDSLTMKTVAQTQAGVLTLRWAAICGLAEGTVRRLSRCAAQRQGVGASCEISCCGYPTPDCVHVGGTTKAVYLLKFMAERAGAHSVEIFPDPCFGLHTSITRPQQETLFAALDEALPRMRSPQHTVWMAAKDAPIRPGCDPANIVANLKLQFTTPVLWARTCAGILRYGIGECYSCGPEDYSGTQLWSQWGASETLRWQRCWH